MPKFNYVYSQNSTGNCIMLTFRQPQTIDSLPTIMGYTSCGLVMNPNLSEDDPYNPYSTYYNVNNDYRWSTTRAKWVPIKQLVETPPVGSVSAHLAKNCDNYKCEIHAGHGYTWSPEIRYWTNDQESPVGSETDHLDNPCRKPHCETHESHGYDWSDTYGWIDSIGEQSPVGLETTEPDYSQHLNKSCQDADCPIHINSNRDVWYWSYKEMTWMQKSTIKERTPNPFKVGDIVVKANEVSVGDGSNRQRYRVIETLVNAAGTDIKAAPIYTEDFSSGDGLWYRHEEFIKPDETDRVCNEDKYVACTNPNCFPHTESSKHVWVDGDTPHWKTIN